MPPASSPGLLQNEHASTQNFCLIVTPLLASLRCGQPFDAQTGTPGMRAGILGLSQGLLMFSCKACMGQQEFVWTCKRVTARRVTSSSLL